MSNRAVIHASDAPQAIGPYSQAVKINNVVYMSGQIPLDPATMQLVAGDITAAADMPTRVAMRTNARRSMRFASSRLQASRALG